MDPQSFLCHRSQKVQQKVAVDKRVARKKILKEIKINNRKFWPVQSLNELQFFMSAFARGEEKVLKICLMA